MDTTNLGNRVARELGEGWTATTDSGRYGFTLVNDGRRIYAQDMPGGRLRIAGQYPATLYGLAPLKITVAADRSPAAIAADIRRRFLPAYEARYAKAVAVAEQDARDAEAREQLAARLMAVSPSTYRAGGRDERDVIFPGYGNRATVNNAGTAVEIEARDVPADLAVRVLTLITGHADPLAEAARAVDQAWADLIEHDDDGAAFDRVAEAIGSLRAVLGD